MIKKLFDKPKIIGICSDANFGKSNLINHIIISLKREFNFNLFTYGVKTDFGDTKIYSIEELEQIKDSVIIIDEYFSLMDLEDRKKRKLIEKTIRLIFHNNNILILAGLPDNFKKFISGKLDIILFGKSTLSDFINGSKIKNICLSYKGIELGSSILNLTPDKFILFDGLHYQKFIIPYYKNLDSKVKNVEILVPKKVQNKEKND